MTKIIKDKQFKTRIDEIEFHKCEYCPEEVQPVIARCLITNVVIDSETNQEQYRINIYVCSQHKEDAKRNVERSNQYLKERG